MQSGPGGRRLSAGVVEGFYGPPWAHDERLALLADARSLGLDNYLYAPKGDPWHRDRWREPYPPDELARLGELASAASLAGVTFVWSVAPGLSMRFSDDADHAALVTKADQVWGAGIRHVAVLFDDVPAELGAADIAAYGPGGYGLGRAHGDACRRFVDDFLTAHGVAEPLLMCPADYAGCDPSPYRAGLAEALPTDARVLWTGRDIVVGEVTRQDVEAAAAAFGRRLVLWDNFPVNDFDRSRAFLGPLRGRLPDADAVPLDGILANAMVEARPSRFALATVGEWAADPNGYRAERAERHALDIVAGPLAAGLEPLVAACRTWPPSAPRDPGLSRAVDAALRGGAEALAEVEMRCRALAEVPLGRDPLLRGLEPWLLTARHTGEAGLAACDLLRAADDDAEEKACRARRLLAVAETDFVDVLRPVLLPFVRATLRRCDAGGARPPGQRATLLTGDHAAPGDDEATAWLERHGLAVTASATWPTPGTDPGDRPDLAVLTPRASAAAAVALRGARVPVLAWGRLVSLGVATESGVQLGADRLVVADAAVRVHRGPGRVTWCRPMPGARVLARTVDQRSAVVQVPAGTPLTDGTPAPAARAMVFLTEDGPGRWLLTPTGWRLLDAALEGLLRSAGTAP